MLQNTPETLHTNNVWWVPGSIGLLFLGLLVGAPLIALLRYVDTAALTEPFTNPWLRRVIAFSLYQAFLSTCLSLLLAIVIAQALARRASFPGRQILLNLFSLSLIIPTIVAVFGIIAVYGRTGWLNSLLEYAGLEFQFSIYGLKGILLAHIFFNMPLATRVLLQEINAVPETNWKTAAQLGMNRRAQLKFLEWPAMARSIPGLALLIFTLCFTSFAIVMTLGGGPRATTIEVAIYQALRFDFNLGTAVSLALVQMSICLVLMFLTIRASQSAFITPRFGDLIRRYSDEPVLWKLQDFLIIGISFIFVFLPILALTVTALNPAFLSVLASSLTVKALVNTVWVGVLSGVLSVSLACLLLSTSRHLVLRLAKPGAGRLVEISGLSILVVPPVVLGTGLFLLLRPYADVFSVALVLVVLVNALIGLPFVLRILVGPIMQVAQQHDRLCASLGISGSKRLKLIEWPQLRKPLGLGLSVATTLSAGDLTVIALFGSERVATLPLLLYQRMGSYRMYDAAATALVLLALCLVLFWTIDRIVGGRSAPA